MQREPVLRVTASNGETFDDPSEDALFMLFEDILHGDLEFFIVERLADTSGHTYIQTIQDRDGSWILERREGSADAHFLTTFNEFRRAHETMMAWVYEDKQLGSIAWARVEHT